MKDTSILSGKYSWVWEEEDNAQSQVDPAKMQALISAAKSTVMRGLIVKAGDGPNVWAQFAVVVKPIKDAGLVAGAWIYCYGNDPQEEANVAIQALADGADFLVLDVETEYAGKAQAAVTMGNLVRAKYPDALIAFAPFCFPENPNFAGYPWSPVWGEVPYAEFLPWIDAVMPQVYWSDWPPKVDVGLKTMDAQMKPWGKPIYPIGQAYADSYTPTSDDYALYEQTCHALGYTGVSFWRAGTIDSNMQVAITKMNFPIEKLVAPLPFTVTAGQTSITWLGEYYTAATITDVKKAAHWLADQYRVEIGLMHPGDASTDTSFSADAAGAVIKDLQAEFAGSADQDVQEAAHWGADRMRNLKGIA